MLERMRNFRMWCVVRRLLELLVTIDLLLSVIEADVSKVRNRVTHNRVLSYLALGD